MVGGSVITTGYLPYARVVAESFHEHNGDADFVVLLVDDQGRHMSADEPFRVVRPSDIGISSYEMDVRGLMYTPTELVCSLRPAFLRYLLNEGAETVILMDTDGCVYGDLQPVAGRARSNGTVLSPHFLVPHPSPGAEDSLELVQIRYGVVNGGFLAVSPSSMTFVEWLHARLARHCINAPEQGLYLDQRWLDLAMALFPHEILTDPGTNVMCLNLHYRDVVWDGDHPSMPEGPLRYFHFLLGFDAEHPEHICDSRFAHKWLPYLDERPGAGRLAYEYAQRLLKHGAVQARQRPQHYDALPGGQPIDRHMRAAYRRGVIEAEIAASTLPPNPFSDGDADGLLRWLAEPCGDPLADVGLSRYTRAIRDIRPDLVVAFPSVPGEHSQGFLAWIDAEREGDWMRQYATDALVTPRIAETVRVDRRMRELYREALRQSRDQCGGIPEPPSPYSDDTAPAFLDWLREAEQVGVSDASVSRYLLRVWAERPDLLAAFPEVPGVDTERYLAWVAAEANEPGVDIPHELLP